MNTIVCTFCKEEKDFEHFRNHKKGKHGKSSRCKDCERKIKSEQRKIPEVRDRINKKKKEYRNKPDKKDLIKSYSKEYSKRPETKRINSLRARKYRDNPDVIEKQKLYYSSEEVKKRMSELARKYRENNKQKQICRHAVYIAIRSGRIIKPNRCEKCDSEDRIEAHHPSYEVGQELVVKWYCLKCHREEHRKYGEEIERVSSTNTEFLEGNITT